MTALRFLTLIWPGLPWLWLRGSLSGLALAVAFAVAVDVAIVVTWIWPGLVELPATESGGPRTRGRHPVCQGP